MALTQSALRELGVTEKEIIDGIIEAHCATVEAVKEKAKESADRETGKLRRQLDELQKQLDNTPKPDRDWQAEYEALLASAADEKGKPYKELHDALKSEFDTFKQTVESEKATAAKRAALHKALKNEHANEKMIELLENRFDLAKIEVEGDKIKGWAELIQPVKEQFSDLFGTFSQIGTNPANPPQGTQVLPDLFIAGFDGK